MPIESSKTFHKQITEEFVESQGIRKGNTDFRFSWLDDPYARGKCLKIADGSRQREQRDSEASQGAAPPRAETRRGVRAQQPIGGRHTGWRRIYEAEICRVERKERRRVLNFSGSSWMRSSTCGRLLSLGKVSKRRDR
ncbi:unnamed protein product [Pleuronectes platessa]|uniref:Uncharacterized protein n=1 Tax=Pleuronectes platessa TaxID=8262 RepID=A0A9N7UQN4_PLEPL|nr:unnamed protein product [Pleuronectes platessa]